LSLLAAHQLQQQQATVVVTGDSNGGGGGGDGEATATTNNNTNGGGSVDTSANNNKDDTTSAAAVASTQSVVEESAAAAAGGDEEPTTTAATAINNKKEKARRKRERQRQAALERQRQIDAETANAGPSPRAVELEQLAQQLAPNNLQVAEIAADGHCLYRAVAAQLNRIHMNHSDKTNNNNNNTTTVLHDYQSVRAQCADALLQHADQYAPFCAHNTDDDSDSNNMSFADYCERVRSSADWGGHLEIRALASALQRSIHVYSVAHRLVVVDPDDNDNNNSSDNNNNESGDTENIQQQPIRLSYHVHDYALGEHYNQVIETDNNNNNNHQDS